MRRLVILLGLFALGPAVTSAAVNPSILILVEGPGDPAAPATGEGRQLANLLGHFSFDAEVRGTAGYTPGTLERYDRVFYIGFTAAHTPPDAFLNDAFSFRKPLTWIHTGIVAFASRHDLRERLGFTVPCMDSTSGFSRVEAGGRSYTKEEPNTHIIEITAPGRVTVHARAVVPGTGASTPYIVQSGDFWYVADPPFSLATPTDRYILFADLLHDILGLDHEHSRSALVRIEDVNPMENPDKLRDVADLLSARGIPFLVAVSPIYVNPAEGLRVTLTQKPGIVDALQYMVRNGGTIVMHGTTHQYKGVTGADFEFWDEQRDGPIPGETADAHRRKIELGLREFMKNGLYPLLWETPHYAASSLLYSVLHEYFSSAVEQRLVINRSEYSQFFPYRIGKDLYGQTLYPENLGFVAIDEEGVTDTSAATTILEGAASMRGVRDAFVGHFFHAFADLRELERIVDGITALGYTYVDVRDEPQRASLRDRVILTGNQSAAVTLQDQYLTEVTMSREGEVVDRRTGADRVAGRITRDVRLEPGQMYIAEPSEFRERTTGVLAGAVQAVTSLFTPGTPPPHVWAEARPLILWNHYARGAAYNDQASFAAAFGALNIPVDTHFVGQRLAPGAHNIIVVPFGYVDSLRQEEYDLLVRWVDAGGFLITDTRNDLAVELGITFTEGVLPVTAVQDQLFPEERIVWHQSEPAVKFDTDRDAEVFCADQATGAPLVVSTPYGRGSVLFFATRFDPLTHLGTSRYPYLMEYVRRAFGLGPIVRRDNLEMYFDPGFRNNVSIEHLVAQWVDQGIRRIHVAGWHEYPKYTYDYDRLIRLARGNGILVYAWLEPPQVSQKFWLEHPRWRERNIRGEDVRPSWRYPMAMTDTACLDAMIGHYTALLHRYEWDGVNIAEVYFEAGRGFADPHLWTPAHPSAAREVERRFGFTLSAAFDERSPRYWKRNAEVRSALTSYRVEKLEQVYRRLFAAIRPIRTADPGFDVLVTAMDALGSPELREQIGVDMGSILGLQKEEGFGLCVEDPEPLWSREPTRYAEIGRRYREILGDASHLLLDLNILAFRKPEAVTPFPTLIQTGTEAFHLLRSAGQGAPRVVTYAESSVNPQDMVFLGYAAAADVEIRREGTEFLSSSPSSFLLQLPEGVREIAVDGVHTLAVRGNLFLVPAGRRRITPSPDPAHELSMHQLQPRLLSATGNILDIRYGARAVTFTYASAGRMLVMFDREPVGLVLDGSSAPVRAHKGFAGSSMVLPPGTHTVEVVLGDLVTYGVTMTSLWSSTGIAAFGLAASSLLVVLYAYRRFRRRMA